MKYILINTEIFSRPEIKEEVITKKSLPMIVQKLIEKVKDIFIVLDESSKIKTSKICSEPLRFGRSRNTRHGGQMLSIRSRVIWQLNDVGDRCAMSGSLISKSLLDAYGQYLFLDKNYFPEGLRAFAFRYAITVCKNINSKKIDAIISVNDWSIIRKQVLHAIETFKKDEDKLKLDFTIGKLMRLFGITKENLRVIAKSEKYNPIVNEGDFYQRIANDTMFVYRKDLFDVENDHFILNPIEREYNITAEQRKLINSFVSDGFSDSFALSNSEGMDLMLRILDVLNGMNPRRVCKKCGYVHPVHIKDVDNRYCVECEGIVETQYEYLENNPKKDLLLELIEEINPYKNQIVIWANRVHSIKYIKEEIDKLDLVSALYYGNVSKKERDKIEENFEKGEIQILIANQTVAGFGLNCLGNCHYAIYYQLDWSCEVMHQSKHRLLRGQLTEPGYCYILIGNKTIEHRLNQSISNGVPFLRDIYSKEFFQ